MGDEEENKEHKIDYTKMAKAVVDEFLTRVYTEAGKSILKKLFWLVFLVIVGYLYGAGHIPHLPTPPTK